MNNLSQSTTAFPIVLKYKYCPYGLSNNIFCTIMVESHIIKITEWAVPISHLV